MKVVILAGGMGTRLAEETETRPKPMVEVGGQPILWHIMKHYAHYGFNEFYVALGYKGEMIKRFFLEYFSLSGDLTVNLSNGDVTPFNTKGDDWVVHLTDTGLHTLGGGRIKRLAPLLKDRAFMATYGDGVANVNLKALAAFHRAQKKLATITAVRPPARFGELTFNGDLVAEFKEKPQIGAGWINGGFMVFEPGALDYIEGDQTILETHTLERLAADGQLAAYRHEGFWQCMDTLRDKRLLDGLWQRGEAPWKIW